MFIKLSKRILRMKVDLFIPCFINQFYPQIGLNTIKILKKFGVEINYNPKQSCCGQPAFNSGYWDETLELAEKFLNDFPNNRIIISPSASCIGFIKKHYSKLSEKKEYLEKLGNTTDKLFELTDFLINHLKINSTGAKFKAKVTYHDSCTALREYGIKSEPRTLLKNVEGIELVEMQENEVCCGFGGTFIIKFKAISEAMVEQKVENAIKTGAEYIVLTEASCMLNIQGYIEKNKLPIKVIHIADILANEI
jgi:L-lactate dehydrogenase complex protein LldE